MIDSKIFKIIVKFLNKEANQKELEELEFWLKDANNNPFFNRIVRTEYLITKCMGDYNLENAKESIGQKLKDYKKKQNSRLFQRIAIAASIVLLAGFYFFNSTEKSSLNTSKVVNQMEVRAGTDKAVLTLENGDEVILEKGGNYNKANAKSNGEEIVYSPNTKLDNKNGHPSFNYLTIPKGGQFFIQLADGTKVWLNSNSKLKYPTAFREGEKRAVELLYGEAYLDVSPSTLNKGSKFVIKTKGQEVSVLGTEFNIKAYDNEADISTTLVEGKIQVQKGSVKRILNPNQQAKINTNSNEIAIQEIDVFQEIAWVKGLFSFNEASLDEMMKILSRWYDVEVIFESAERKKFVFTGILERTKSFTDIIELIEETSDGEVQFELNDKTLTIR